MYLANCHVRNDALDGILSLCRPLTVEPYPKFCILACKTTGTPVAKSIVLAFRLLVAHAAPIQIQIAKIRPWMGKLRVQWPYGLTLFARAKVVAFLLLMTLYQHTPRP